MKPFMEFTNFSLDCNYSKIGFYEKADCFARSSLAMTLGL